MKMRNLSVLVILTALIGAPIAQAAEPAAAAKPSVNDPAYTYKTPRLNRAAIDALLAKPEELLIIDVRRPDEVTTIGGFPAYLSIQANELQKNFAFIPANRTIVTVSNHAHRAGAAGDLLAANGFTVAGAIGVEDYEAEGGTLIKIAPPKAATAAPVPSSGSAPAVASGQPAKR
jgi:rhodanese-related sulfurtransferase